MFKAPVAAGNNNNLRAGDLHTENSELALILTWLLNVQTQSSSSCYHFNARACHKQACILGLALPRTTVIGLKKCKQAGVFLPLQQKDNGCSQTFLQCWHSAGERQDYKVTINISPWNMWLNINIIPKGENLWNESFINMKNINIPIYRRPKMKACDNDCMDTMVKDKWYILYIHLG